MVNLLAAYKEVHEMERKEQNQAINLISTKSDRGLEVADLRGNSEVRALVVSKDTQRRGVGRTARMSRHVLIPAIIFYITRKNISSLSISKCEGNNLFNTYMLL